MKSDQDRSARPRGGSESHAKSSAARQRSGEGSRSRPLRIQQRAREARELASTVEEAIDDIGQFLREQAERRPYVSIATATGVGYILGGGIPSRVISLLVRFGGRFAIEMFLRELVGSPGVAGTPRVAAPEPQRSVS